MKHSFGVLKPDCVRRGLVDQAFGLVTARGLRIAFSKQVRFSTTDVEHLYHRCRESPFFGNLIRFMTSGDVVIYVAESLNGDCAIEVLNDVTGHTNPALAEPNTLRSLGTDVCENISHSTATEDTFWAEVRYFLSEEEIQGLKLGQ